MTPTPDLFPAPVLPRIPVTDAGGTSRAAFPVGRVFCVGRNYAAHAREMGEHDERAPPFFFMKPFSAVALGPEMAYPPATSSLHHEVELVLGIGKGLEAAAVDQARDAVVACGVGIDFTRRDRQAEAKAQGRPWEAGKVFDAAAACGALRAGDTALLAPTAGIGLEVDGVERQRGTLASMIWRPEEIIVRLSELFGLRAGDLVFTGTPEGVGEVEPGQRLRAWVDGLPPLAFQIRP